MTRALSRRDLLKAGAGLAGAIALGRPTRSWAAAGSAADDLRVYLIAIDSLRPDEITPDLTPNLTALRAGGVWYESVSILPATSTQNFAAMLTGALPQDNGYAYQIFVGDAQRFWVDHLFTRLARERPGGPDVHTFLYSDTSSFKHVFNTQEDDKQEGPVPPDQVPPKTGGFDPDPIGRLQLEALRPGPQFGFLHLGGPDLVAHTLPTPEPGEDALTAARAEREAAVRGVDRRLGMLIETLRNTQIPGRDYTAWSRTVLLIVSDHGMEFVTQDGWVDFETQLQLKGYRSPEQFALPGEKSYEPRGTADGSVFVDITSPDPNDIERVAGFFRDMTSVSGTEGVALVVTRTSTPSLHNLGVDMERFAELSSDILAFAKDGHTFWPGFVGIHGHPLTQSNVLLVSGAHPWLTERPKEFVDFPRPTQSEPADPVGRPSVLSIAPTVGWLFDLPQASYYENDRLQYAFNRS